MSHRDLGFGGFFEDDPLRSGFKRISIGGWVDDRLAKALLYLGHQLNQSTSSLYEFNNFLNAPECQFLGVSAGYTYLFQLASHDVLQSSRMVHPFEDNAPTPTNLRRVPLALETIFGGGPIACPFAYDTRKVVTSDDPEDLDGVELLRLGLFRDSNRAIKKRHQPPQDLPRARFNPDGPENPDAPYTEVLIADARNDDNNILAQLTVLFHRLHNALATQTALLKDPSGTRLILPRHRSRIARQATIRIYHRILREDLLPTLMHSDVLALYDPVNPKSLLGLSPQENADHFAFAARAAHSMVRNKYKLNSTVSHELSRIISTSSLHAPLNLPTPQNWKIDWTLFFPEDGASDPRINWAIKLGPHFAPTMTQTVAANKVDDSLPAGAPIRDLLADFHTQLVPVETLLQTLAPQLPTLASVPPQDKVAQIITAGFGALKIDEINASDHNGESVDLQPFRAAPSLPLFLLFEAQSEGNAGRTFGPLGSAIIGDCFMPLLKKDTSQVSLEDQVVEALEKLTFPGGPISSMAELIKQLPDN